MMTPSVKLKSLPKSEKYLKDGVTFEIMDNTAYAITDNESDMIYGLFADFSTCAFL